MRRAKFVVLAMAMLWCATARAQQDAALARAKTHFEAGRALYNLGNYQDAVREFAAGYELAPKPQFLINLGQCYRRLEDFDKAREMYQKYLAEVPATEPERAQVESLLAEVDREAKAHPTRPPPPRPANTSTTTPGGSTPGGTPVLIARPPERTPFIKRHWWIIPVSAAVVAGVAVGIYFGTKSADCPASLGCINLTP